MADRCHEMLGLSCCPCLARLGPWSRECPVYDWSHEMVPMAAFLADEDADTKREEEVLDDVRRTELVQLRAQARRIIRDLRERGCQV